MSNESPPLLYLPEPVLDELGITTDEVVDRMERLFLGQAQKTAWNAPKGVILPGDGRYVMSTLSTALDPPFVAVKSVVLNPGNPARGLPQINGLIMLLDSETGIPAAIVDGNWITAIRTAGASALVARRLAHPASQVLSFIGCGVQAHSHLRLFCDLFPLKEIRVYGRGTANRKALCAAAESNGLRALDCRTARQAVDGADLIVSSITMTAEVAPFVDPLWLKPGVFLSSTDCAKPFKPEGMEVFGCIIIDDVEQERSMADPMVRTDLISGDIAALVSGRISANPRDGHRKAFIFRGVGLGDLALSALACEKARLTGKGLSLG